MSRNHGKWVLDRNINTNTHVRLILKSCAVYIDVTKEETCVCNLN